MIINWQFRHIEQVFTENTKKHWFKNIDRILKLANKNPRKIRTIYLGIPKKYWNIYRLYIEKISK